MSSNSLDLIDDVQLRQSILSLLSSNPETAPVINQLIDHFTSKLRLSSEPANPVLAKKRKLDPPNGNLTGSEPPIVTIQDVSVQSPVRKKLNLVFSATYLTLVSPKGPTVEHRLRIADLAHALCVSTPEKTAKSWTIALFPADAAAESIIFGFADKEGTKIVRPDNPSPQVHDATALCALLTTLLNLPLIRPAPLVFTSSTKPATSGDRKGEPSHHVTAYLKAKDGGLFPLPTGLLFGFRKPVLFIPLSDVASATFHGVTSRTFNMTVRLKDGRVALGGGGIASSTTPSAGAHRKQEDEAGEAGMDYEFSMIGQADFGAIDDYMKRAQVVDESLSSQNKAVEKPPKEKKSGKGGANEGPGTAGFLSTEYEEDEEDGDFQPDDDDDVAEEFDSNADEDDDDDDDDDEEENGRGKGRGKEKGNDGDGGEGEDDEDELMN
ncbi:hypothetical protein BC936DRAFT_145771 [Jimgerdemannia flammicorona]|uniref:Histone chaperone RTT106/FACT complex subunit SPT16-like middle domain-containing protein n=1 Tax=Jimgerdemannia flammicorona TaxID=994334 RepID=A0A433D998_9FUNG|nr:hypothetical protein BC936DRAFT_145771 [Jimgerdemannia flammicorona]